MWKKSYRAYQITQATAIAVDNAGGVYVTGTSYRKGLGAATYIATIRYNALTGKESWITRFSGEEDGNSYFLFFR
ncbi:SBBP repeat-containing protein [Pontibacter sp. MBLB2868]|uniref:SBBP repeat-containing protein n=1 Tax=Pontibacter sp. MBLB2868 TaxID=3451555 RepID=UPI003F74B996